MGYRLGVRKSGSGCAWTEGDVARTVNSMAPRSHSRGRKTRRRTADHHHRPEIQRVFFVGAGLSAGMLYPVGSTLMLDLVQYLRGERTPRLAKGRRVSNSLRKDPANRTRAAEMIDVVGQVLQRYFAVNLDEMGQIDVAEFFSIAHTLAESPALFADGSTQHGVGVDGIPSATSLFRDLSAVTRSYFYDLGRLAGNAPADIHSLVRSIRPGQDVVINFNWDEELDFELDAQTAGLGYMLQAASADGNALMLKPHGSIGWYDVKQGIANAGAYFIADEDGRVPRALRRIVAYPENETPFDLDWVVPPRRRHSLFECPPVITPPTFSKRFDFREQQFIWQDVVSVCRQARDFVFLGYSLPRDDFLTRAAIRSALHDSERRKHVRCLLVDLTFDDKRANFESVFGQGLSHRHHFLKWRFGTRDPSFGEKLEAALENAHVPE